MPILGEIKRGRHIGREGNMGSQKYIYAACLDCGKERWVQLLRDYPVASRCQKCGSKHHSKTGEQSNSWKGGRRKYGDGYIGIWLAQDDFFHLMANNVHCVMEHRLVMAKHLNRCLLPWEIVHHKNDIHDDNRLENLELITDRRFHLVDAQAKRYIGELEARIKKLESQLIKAGLNQT